MAITRSIRALSGILGATILYNTHNMASPLARASSDPFDCKETVCKSKMDIFSKSMKFHQSMSTTKIEKGEDEGCPVDKDDLGQRTWTLLHTLAAYFPENPKAEHKVYAEFFFKSLAALYPCKICAEHMEKYVESKPPDARNREALSLWVCALHNEVNDVLGKKKFACDIYSLDKRWKYGKKSCWEEGDPEGQEKL